MPKSSIGLLTAPAVQAQLAIPFSRLLGVFQEGKRLQLVHISARPVTLRHHMEQQAGFPSHLDSQLSRPYPSHSRASTQEQSLGSYSGPQAAGLLNFLSGSHHSVWSKGWGRHVWYAMLHTYPSDAAPPKASNHGGSIVSNDVPGWLAVSQVELLDEAQAYEMHGVLLRLLAACINVNTRLIGF